MVGVKDSLLGNTGLLCTWEANDININSCNIATSRGRPKPRNRSFQLIKSWSFSQLVLFFFFLLGRKFPIRGTLTFDLFALTSQVRQPRPQPAVHPQGDGPLLHHQPEPRLRRRPRHAARRLGRPLHQRQRSHQRGHRARHPARLQVSRAAATAHAVSSAQRSEVKESLFVWLCQCSVPPRALGRTHRPGRPV